MAVDKLNFSTNKDQLYDDCWRHKVRRCEYKGRCPVCSRRMYWFDDGENDPRGPLGDHAATYMTPADEGLSKDDETPFWYCFACSNEELNYRTAVNLLKDKERKRA